MRYDITLRIAYTYTGLADAGRQLLRLIPADLPGEQRVIASNLQVDPQPAERIRRYDFFGNECIEIASDEPVEETVFTLKARVDRHGGHFGLDVSPSRAELARELDGVASLDGRSPHHFRHSSRLVGRDPQVEAWAWDVAANTVSAYGAVERICRTLHAEMAFDPKATEVDTPFAKAFSQRRGVCQDYSHIAIAALRSVGIPAGYVSGFLRTIPPKGKPRLEGADAMHAWVRAWCGNDMGWVEFDPTNAMPAGQDHVVIARGRDYFDVAPVKGTLRIAGTQKSTQAVDMIEA